MASGVALVGFVENLSRLGYYGFMKKQVSKYLAEIGKRGGSARTSAKSEAARANGRLGGRPKKVMSDELDSFGVPLTEDQILLMEMANVPSRIHEFGVDVKLQLLQPGKRVYQHAERVKVFRGSNPNDKELSFVVSLRESPDDIDFIEGRIFLSKKEYNLVLNGIRKYRIPFFMFWYSPGMDLDELKQLMNEVDAGILKEIPEYIREKMHD